MSSMEDNDVTVNNYSSYHIWYHPSVMLHSLAQVDLLAIESSSSKGVWHPFCSQAENCGEIDLSKEWAKTEQC